MSAAWGEGGGAEPTGEGAASQTKFASGLFKIDQDKWRALLHDPTVVAAVTERAQAIADAANSMAVLTDEERKRYPGEPYMVVLDPEAPERFRAVVKAANMAGVVDDAKHSTLYKAWNAHPSDPFMYSGANADVPLPEEQLERIQRAIQEIAGRYVPEEAEGGEGEGESGGEEGEVVE